jgi:hypothetical protein
MSRTQSRRFTFSNHSRKELLQLVRKIHRQLDRREWSSDTSMEIAELLNAAGFIVREPIN